MRERDRVEIFNTVNHDSPDKLAHECVLLTALGKAGVVFVDDRPTGIVGVSPIRDGVWGAWAFGTDEWRKGAGLLTRFAIKDLKPFVIERGAHRVQAESRADHIEAHRWLRWFGAKPEGTLSKFGRDGSDFIMFAWNA